MADRHASEVVRSLHQWHIHPRTDPTAKYAVTEPGRPDVMFIAPAFSGGYIEIKSGLDGFSFDQWHENQREWLLKWGQEVSYWFWLNIGTNRPNAKVLPRRAFLVPLMTMLEVEGRVSIYQRTLPYQVRSGMRKELQAQKLDCLTLFANYQLVWQGNGTWSLPASHLFRSMFIRPLPQLGLWEIPNERALRNDYHHPIPAA